ncbi:MAG: hypothetical protein N2035_07620 [Chthoniobacterales bacterium]|nr:hypothetical protein [Chthoniobacterales bacterium]
MPLPITYRQDSYWGSKKNSLLSISFGCKMDYARWRGVWDLLVTRHPILRSSFSSTRSILLEHEKVEGKWEEEDWSGKGQDEITQRWKLLYEEAKNLCFETGSYPLWKFYWLILPDRTNHLLGVFHRNILDRQSVRSLIWEWFLFYSNWETKNQISLTPSLSVALGSIENGEEENVYEKIFSNLSDLVAEPFVIPGYEHVSCEEGQFEIEIENLSIDWVFSLSQSLEVETEYVWSLLWGGFLAKINPVGESLSAVKFNLLDFLPPESEKIIGRLEIWVPLKIDYPREEDDFIEWLQKGLHKLKQIKRGVLKDWTERAKLETRVLGLPEGWQIPSTGLKVISDSLNDYLHTHLPQWLCADIRWDEEQDLPIICEVEYGKFPILRLKWKRERLTKEQAFWLLKNYVSFLETYRLGRKTTITNIDEKWFSCYGTNSNFCLIEDVIKRLGENQNHSIIECGSERYCGKDILAFCNQFRRYFRKNKLINDGEIWVCLGSSHLCGLVLLSFLFERVKVVVWDKTGIKDIQNKLLEGKKCDLFIFDSSIDFSFEGLKKICLDEILEKKKSQSCADLVIKNYTKQGSFIFKGAGEIEIKLSENDYWYSLQQAEKWFNFLPNFRILSTARGGTPSVLEELLLAIYFKATLIFPLNDVSSTRSAFQEELEQYKISHLILPIAQWIDWVHFLKEVGLNLPSDLRVVILRGGRVSSKCLQAWGELNKDVCKTWIVNSPLGLLGIGWLSDVGTELTKNGIVCLGKNADNCLCVCNGANERNLPEGFLGWLEVGVWCKNSKNNFGSEIRWLPTGMLGFSTSGSWFAINFLDWPEDFQNSLPFRIRQKVELTLLRHEKIFDAIIKADDKRERNLAAWILPWDSEARTLDGLDELVKLIFENGWKLKKVSLFSKHPLDTFGRVLVKLLPDPEYIQDQIKVFEGERKEHLPDEVSNKTQNSKEHLNVHLSSRDYLEESQKNLRESEVLIEFKDEIKVSSLSDAILFYGKMPIEGLEENFAIHYAESFRVFQTKHSIANEIRDALLSKNFLQRIAFICGGERFLEGIRIYQNLVQIHKISWKLIVISPILHTGRQHSLWQRCKDFFVKMCFSNFKERQSVSFERCELPGQILCSQNPSEEIIEIFPFGIFYQCDLSTPSNAAAAIRELIEDQS